MFEVKNVSQIISRSLHISTIQILHSKSTRVTWKIISMYLVIPVLKSQLSTWWVLHHENLNSLPYTNLLNQDPINLPGLQSVFVLVLMPGARIVTLNDHLLPCTLPELSTPPRGCHRCRESLRTPKSSPVSAPPPYMPRAVGDWGQLVRNRWHWPYFTVVL